MTKKELGSFIANQDDLERDQKKALKNPSDNKILIVLKSNDNHDHVTEDENEADSPETRKMVG